MRKFVFALLALFCLAGCGVSLWLGLPPSAVVSLSSDSGADAMAVQSAPVAPTSRALVGGVYDAGFQTGNGLWFYTSIGTDGGSGGTITVPTGAYATGVYCMAGAAGGTLTITPSGPSSYGITDAQVGPPINILANQQLDIGPGLLSGGSSTNSGVNSIMPTELGAGSVLTFAGATCTVTMFEYGGK